MDQYITGTVDCGWSSDMEFKVMNLVAKTSAGCSINMETLASTLQRLRYDPTRFRAGTLKMPDGGSVMIWPNGSLVFLGFTSMVKVEEAGLQIKKILKNFGCISNDFLYTICSVTGWYNYKKPIDLTCLYEKLRNFVTIIYEPELFPSLNFRYKNGTISVFHTGKIIITGTKKVEDCWSIAKDIFDHGIDGMF